MQIGERFIPSFYPHQGNAYMGNGVRDLRNYPSWHHRHFVVGFYRLDYYNFGTISHYEYNFHHFFEKKNTASIICTFCYNFAVQTELSFIEHATNILGPRSVLQANLSNEIIYLSVYCPIHKTWVQQEVTRDSPHKTQRADITSSFTWGGVRVLVDYCLSIYTCQTMN